MVNIRIATVEDVIKLGNNLRKQDIDEVKALVGCDYKNALMVSFCSSDSVYAAELYGDIVCIFGVTPIGDGGGHIWLLGSDVMNEIPIEFVRKSKILLKEFLLKYNYLENYVDDRNSLSKQWLKWLGFIIDEPQRMGIENRLFSRFRMGGINQCV